MNYTFDDLARSLASGISRRQALKRMGAGLTGLLLSSLGIKKAFATVPVTCGACQACDLDTSTCGLPCSPASAGQTLCTMASQDGTYQRLLQHLTSNGFEAPGPSQTAVLYKGGSLYQSAVGTVLQNSTVPGQIARVAFLLDPSGGITCAAVVVNNLIPIYGLNVDASGRIVQTIATHTSTTPPAGKSSTPLAGSKAVVPNGPKQSGIQPAAANDLVSQAVCNRLVDVVCGVIDVTILCWLIGEAACAAGAVVTLGAIEIPCALAVGLLCAAGGYAACEAEKEVICACDYNEQSCNGVCCDQCQDCVNGACVPGSNVSSCPSGVCCDGICCANGDTCVNGVCTSPNSACLGATCETFVPCSTNPDCVCGTIAEGGGLCVPGSTACAPLTTCSSTADCEAGTLCLIDSCCGVGVCVPTSLQCPPQSSAATKATAVQPPKTWNGPTLGHR